MFFTALRPQSLRFWRRAAFTALGSPPLRFSLEAGVG